MSPISRGFPGRSRVPAGEEDRVPPGQHVTTDFPVLSAGPTPRTPLPEWTFSITQGGDTLKSWTWQEMQGLAETVWPASQHRLAFVCGPTTFVEAVAENLIGLGYPPERIKAERFGGI